MDINSTQAHADQATPRPKRAGLRDDRLPAHVSPLPPPEAVFLDWLLAVPATADLQAAARVEIERIDRRCLKHPDLDKLRTLLLAFAGEPMSVAISRGY